MGRKIIKKEFPKQDSKYKSLLISVMTNRILSRGKKFLAQKILYKALNYIKTLTEVDPLIILEQAIRNCAPKVALKSKQFGKSMKLMPTLLNSYYSINWAAKILINSAKKRNDKSFILKLANELIDTSKKIGGSIKKRDEIHKMAEGNKVFSYIK